MLEERFRRSFERSIEKPEILPFVKARFDKAKIIKDCVEKKLNVNIEDLFIEQSRSRSVL